VIVVELLVPHLEAEFTDALGHEASADVEPILVASSAIEVA
jgi:hypothetical protein